MTDSHETSREHSRGALRDVNMKNTFNLAGCSFYVGDRDKKLNSFYTRINGKFCYFTLQNVELAS